MRRLAEVVDSRLAASLDRIESRVDYRPLKVAAWSMATGTVFAAAAAGLGTVAAGATAYAAVRVAIKVTREDRESRKQLSAGHGQFDD